ncbi:tetraacyldisaccharide 4'-kinase [Xenophilus aerolatus]|nr:tetraacyldisaccharide 4'-kinase [Xenophilus aerolatus]
MLQHAWLRRGPVACLLWPLSLAYRAIAALRRVAYRRGWKPSQGVGVPLVVVGNVVAGGAGKTPVVMAVVRHLQARGLAAGVVSRGYGRRTQDAREVHADSDPRDVGDEPLLVHRSTGAPVVVDRDRVAAAQRLLAAHPDLDVIVSDDGLQHLALRRAVEICVFDDRGVGNGWLLPAGPLREPWPRECDLVLHTGEHPAFAGFTARRALADHALTQDGRQVPLEALARMPNVVALAGIAQPQRFFDMLRACGIEPARCVALPDHHDFDRWSRPAGGPFTLICTEKDAAKLWQVAPDALAVPLVFTPEPAFFAALDARLSFGP